MIVILVFGGIGQVEVLLMNGMFEDSFKNQIIVTRTLGIFQHHAYEGQSEPEYGCKISVVKNIGENDLKERLVSVGDIVSGKIGFFNNIMGALFALHEQLAKIETYNTQDHQLQSPKECNGGDDGTPS